MGVGGPVLEEARINLDDESSCLWCDGGFLRLSTTRLATTVLGVI